MTRQRLGPPCVIEGCDSPQRGRGWCATHWSRWRRHGDPGQGPRLRVMGGFWGKVDRTGDCWLWLGGRHKGYGRYRNRQAHRVSWESEHGPIPEAIQLDHLCRNRACVRPSHLEPVTGSENLLRSPLTLASLNAGKTKCLRGHPFSPENTYVIGRRRVCRECCRIRDRRRRAVA